LDEVTVNGIRREFDDDSNIMVIDTFYGKLHGYIVKLRRDYLVKYILFELEIHNYYRVTSKNTLWSICSLLAKPKEIPCARESFSCNFKRSGDLFSVL
jgi:hypothetical protein